MEQVNYNSGEVLESLNNKLDRDFNNMAVNSVNFAKYSNNVTNCITEIPQDIKLELVDGTLTLKAGSKVYIPNGKNEDGSNKFDIVIIQNDLTSTFDNTNQKMVFVRTDSQSLRHCNKNGQQVSGTSASISWGYWYDITNNIIKFTTDGSIWQTTLGISLPICLATGDNGSVSSIEQVFNGFGYIGSTVFALSNVKGLIPNGRNKDGSLKNVERTTTNLIVRTLTNQNGDILVGSNLDNAIGLYSATGFVSDEVNNINTNNQIIISKITATNGVITSFSPKTAFHAVDHNDSSWVAGQAMPSGKYNDLTLGASGTTYIAPANGWFAVSKKTSSTNQFVEIVGDAWSQKIVQPLANNSTNASLPVRKGDAVKVNYNAEGTTNYFRFIYAEGEN